MKAKIVSGGYISIIKAIRHLTGLGLKDSKSYCDNNKQVKDGNEFVIVNTPMDLEDLKESIQLYKASPYNTDATITPYIQEYIQESDTLEVNIKYLSDNATLIIKGKGVDVSITTTSEKAMPLAQFILTNLTA